MQLIRAINPSRSSRIAFVGAGGKTTALFQLARQMSVPVLITTTTHLGEDQPQLADKHIVLEKNQNVILNENPRDQVTLLTGGHANQRFGSLTQDQLQQLNQYAATRQFPLLVEADGSRRLPVKAPASHEPAIPEWCDQVVVVCGLSAFGKVISAEIIHRIDAFSQLTTASTGKRLSSQHLLDLLIHPAGGLKGIPTGAQKTVLLNQADSPYLISQATGMAEELLQAYDKVLSASLMRQTVHACYQRTAAVILAAGGSKRFGSPKQLALWKGKPLIRSVATQALEAHLSPVIIVMGAEAQSIRNAVNDLPVECVLNDRWKDGQSTSIQTGLNQLDSRSGACIFLMADQPQVTVQILTALSSEHAISLAPIIAPLIRGERGNPVLFDRATFQDLMAIRGDMGGRALFSQYPIHWLDWVDESLLVDVDTPDDLQRLEQMR